ncbi:NAD(P)/FAD-dependent oxidoreductase, partial [Salmonella enterica subsp. enterica serovar Virchow]|nr:NAD(P)/FAD-dependent oxidoreductase [Salmonella enterica subsp. enterica serovar Virchow]
MARNIVILGSGHGGVQAAASLREDGFDGKIRIVSADTNLPYHKPPLSKTFIKDQAAQPQPLRGEIFYQNQDIDLELGVTVESIDARSRRLTLGNGAALDFDSLILATGSRPRLLPQAQHLTGVYALRTLADARLIREAAASAQEVVVIGAGFIGLEIAATLSAGRKVTVIEAAPRVLGRGVARAVADHVATRLTESGVRIITGARIDGFESEDGRVSGIRLAGNERIP